MASAEKEEHFGSWLRDLLDSHGADGEVFGEYVNGALETMEGSSVDEMSENLQDILSGCVEDEEVCKTVTATIISRWLIEVERRKKEEMKQRELDKQSESEAQSVSSSQVTELPSSRQASVGLGGLSETEKKRLVAQYGCESGSDSGVDEEDYTKGGGGTTFQGLFQNINASSVAEAERQKKKEQKATHEAKLERDKKSREAQKQKVQDRKEKEKKRTQKQERRR